MLSERKAIGLVLSKTPRFILPLAGLLLLLMVVVAGCDLDSGTTGTDAETLALTATPTASFSPSASATQPPTATASETSTPTSADTPTPDPPSPTSTETATDTPEPPLTKTPVPPTRTPRPKAPTPNAEAAVHAEATPAQAEPQAEPTSAYGKTVNGKWYDAYVPAATKLHQYFHYTCEFDAAWVVLKSNGIDATLQDQIDIVGLDKSIEPRYEETTDGIFIYGGDILHAYSGDYTKNFLARSTGR